MADKGLVLVTGGAGFLGARVVELLRQEGWPVRVFDQHPAAPGVESVVGDICSPADCDRAMQGVVTVMHLAALYRDDVRPIERYYTVNVDGTARLLEAATRHGVSRVIFASSFSVYGLENTQAGEEGALAPVNHYGHSKLRGEEMLRKWCAEDRARSVVMIRPSVIFGEGNRGNVWVLASQIASRRFVMLGRGENPKSMAYVGNIASFFVYLLPRLVPGVSVINYADKPDMRVKEIVAAAAEALDVRVRRIPCPRFVALAIGRAGDLASAILRRPIPVSHERVLKFLADTSLPTARLQATGFVAPHVLREAFVKTLVSEFKARK